MTILNVTNSAQLSAALQKANGGDIINLAGGNYGDFTITSKTFTSGVTIASADSSAPATFSSLTINGSSNINFDGVHVDWSPSVTAMSFSSAVVIDGSTGIGFIDGVIKGGPAISGVSADSVGTDASDNVIGMPTGRGMTIQNSSEITVTGSDISSFMRGIAIASSEKVTISDNEIHHLRKTAIVGGGSDLVIEGNYLHSSQPWKIGTAGGDHADFIALWTNPKQVGPTTNVTIKDNILDQGDGAGVLGMWLQGDAAGFANVVIEGNAILGGDTQGIMMSNTVGGRVTDNVLVQTTAYAKAPGIILLEGAKNIVASGNLASAVADKNLGTTGNTIIDNVIAQKLSALKAGFYDSQYLHDKLAGMIDVEAIYNFVAETVGAYHGDGNQPPPVATQPPLVEPSAPDAGQGGQVLVGGSANNNLTGGAANDTLNGGGGVDLLRGGDGDDTYIVPNSLATVVENSGQGVDTVIARGNYTLGANVENLIVSDAATNSWSGTGNTLNNVITGNAGNNSLNGAEGADTISGGAGADAITGGVGSDQLTGGAGVDTFRFALKSGKDVITDFGVGGHDLLDIQAFTKAGYKAQVIDAGDDTVISFANGDAITLMGVDSHHLVAHQAGFTI